MNSQTECKSGAVAYGVAIIGAFLIVGGLVWIMNSYTRPAPLGAERAAERKKILVELQAANVDVLTHYAWENQGKGLVRLPIEQAMKLVAGQTPAALHSNLVERIEKATKPMVLE